MANVVVGKCRATSQFIVCELIKLDVYISKHKHNVKVKSHKLERYCT